MKTPSQPAIYGVVGLAAFGVAYDSGLFGHPDGYDHSAVVTVAATGVSASSIIGAVYISNPIEGSDFRVYTPNPYWTLKSSI